MKIEIDESLFDKLKQISEISDISMKKMVNNEIKDLLYHIAHDPAVFLDHFIGIENVENPMKIIKDLKPIVNISEDLIESLEGRGIVNYIKDIKSHKTIKVEIELLEEYKPYFEYLSSYFNLDPKEYIEDVIKKEIKSRNGDLGLF